MNVIDNAWKVPLTAGGIYKIVVDEDKIELYRIFSGKYISDELKLKKDIEYIDSLIVPGATDPVEPADLFNRLKNTVKKITEEYYARESSKMENIKKNMTSPCYETIELTGIKNINMSDFNDDRFPELIINTERFIFLFTNFSEPSADDKKRYNEIKKIIEHLKNKIGID